MASSCRVFFFTSLLWVSLTTSCIYLFNQKPDTVRPIVSEVESWWNGISTSVAEYDIYGGEASSSEVVAPESAIRGSISEEDKEKIVYDNTGNKSHHEIYFKNQTHLTEGMPYWLGKYPFMPAPEKIADDDRICYVHVGKTAGSSMACSLGFSYQMCPVERVRLPEGNLPMFATSMIHKQFNDCKDKKIALYLFVVRDPLARMQSWFTYERPIPGQRVWSEDAYARKKLLFVDCPFPTIDALGGDLGLGGNNETLCSQLAHDAVTGAKAMSHHNYYNYAYYFNEVMEQDRRARIVVLRTEHLEQDWRSIETKILHGPEPFADTFAFPTKHASGKKPEDMVLSPESQRNLCHALCAEIQVYKHILARAQNLGKDDYATSMSELKLRCPAEAAARECNE